MTDTRTVLKTLADTTFDSAEGYRKAADKASSTHLKQLLMRRAEQRGNVLERLNAELVRHGGERVTSGTTSGELHRMWTGLTDMFENGDEAAAERVEEGEDYLAGKFEKALESKDLDPQARTTIKACFTEVKEGERFGDMLEKAYD